MYSTESASLFFCHKARVSFSLLLKMSKGNFGNLPLALQDLLHLQFLKVPGITDYLVAYLS
jgi:hypothetical protein